MTPCTSSPGRASGAGSGWLRPQTLAERIENGPKTIRLAAMSHKFMSSCTADMSTKPALSPGGDLRATLGLRGLTRASRGRGGAYDAKYVRFNRYCRLLSTGNSIDGQNPETAAETDPVCWQTDLGSLRRGFTGLFGTPCERTLGFGSADQACLASQGGFRKPSVKSFRSSKSRPLKGMKFDGRPCAIAPR